MAPAGETQMVPRHMSDEISQLRAMILANSYVPPMVMRSASELGIFKIMATKGKGIYLSAYQIAFEMSPTNPKAVEVIVDRMLYVLTCEEIVTCKIAGDADSRVRLYQLAPGGKQLEENAAPFFLVNQDEDRAGGRDYLTAAVRGPFKKADGMTASEDPAPDPRINKDFDKGMFDLSTKTMDEILKNYKGFKRLESLVYIGGGYGSVVHRIVSKYEIKKGINFDSPTVTKDAFSYNGVEHFGGDMLDSVPTAEAIFMKWICRNRSDEDCMKLLKNCYDALPDHGKVIVAERILPEAPDSRLTTKEVIYNDVVMRRYNPAGKERTKNEFEALAKGAGFQGFEVMCCALNTNIIEFRKKVKFN